MADLYHNQSGPVSKKSRIRYHKQYEAYCEWKERNGYATTTENILLSYFHELAKKWSTNSLLTCFTLLKYMIGTKEQVNIKGFLRLKAFMRTVRIGGKQTPGKTFSNSEFERFLQESADYDYLVVKVAAIFLVVGACRISEIVNISRDDVVITTEHILVKIPATGIRKWRVFAIEGEKATIVKKYMELIRPPHFDMDRFFLQYSKGKCVNKTLGRKTIEQMPKMIAEWLLLPDPEEFTQHAFKDAQKEYAGCRSANVIYKGTTSTDCFEFDTNRDVEIIGNRSQEKANKGGVSDVDITEFWVKEEVTDESSNSQSIENKSDEAQTTEIKRKTAQSSAQRLLQLQEQAIVEEHAKKMDILELERIKLSLEVDLLKKRLSLK